jgi:hypothetical protein
MRSRHVSASPSPQDLIGPFSDRGASARTHRDMRNPRGMCPARIDQKRPVRLIDDLDDLARPWLNDHAAVIDDRVPVLVGGEAWG